MNRLADIKAEIEKLSKTKEKKMKAECVDLEKEVNELAKEFTRVQGDWKIKKKTYDEELAQQKAYGLPSTFQNPMALN